MHFDNASAAPSAGSRGWPFAVASGILGWVLDAFDFFVITFLFDELAARYHVSIGAIVGTLFWTLAMRPVGALVFGALADRFGRRRPLMICVAYFSIVTVCSALAPTYGVFVLCRCLYGMGMGGYWGIGASYAMESAPTAKRGILSGFMQSGYSIGNLLAAVGMQTVAPRFGWHAMFYVGTVVAAAIIVLTAFAPESKGWQKASSPSLGHMFHDLRGSMGIFFYLLALMTAMTCLSHGTQDLYPHFLSTLPFMKGAHVFGMQAKLGIPVVYNVGAIVGALIIGQVSQKLGRRKAILLALAVCLASMHGWAFGATVFGIMAGAFMMQVGVQGAFGVIPAHLNELSPDAIRGLFAGFVYQLGVLIASPVGPVQHTLSEHLGYPWALTSFELCVIAALALLMVFGPEKHGKDLGCAPAIEHAQKAAA